MNTGINRRLAALETASFEAEVKRYLDFWESLPVSTLEALAAESAAFPEVEETLNGFSFDVFQEGERRWWLQANGDMTGFQEYMAGLLCETPSGQPG